MMRFWLGTTLLAASAASGAEELTASQIVERMASSEAERFAALKDYTVTRRYSLENRRFRKSAELVVRMEYAYPGRKTFQVVSERGSKTVRSRVLRKMIEAETEARHDARITTANYEFRLVGSEAIDGRECHLMETLPRTNSKFLFRGRIWVDKEDFAVVRVEGSPARNPSFWTRNTRIVHQYRKIGPFWLAASNRSSTDALVFGHTEVTIDYYDYQIAPDQHTNGN